MKYASIYKLPALIGLEFPHGKEVVHTSVDDMPIHYATIDVDGAVKVWNSLCEPELDEAGVWHNANPEDGSRSFTTCFVDALDDGRYPWFADSLRRIRPGDMLSD